MQLIPPKAPNLPVAKPAYVQQDEELFNTALRLYFNRLDGTFQQLLLGFNHIAAYYCTVDTTAALANTAYSVVFDTEGTVFGFELQGSPTTQILTRVPGVFNLQFSVQLDSSGGTHTVSVWARVNGLDVANTARQTVVNGATDDKAISGNWLLDLDRGDYVEFVWAVSNTNIFLSAQAAAAPIPAIPAVAVTIGYLYPNGAI